MRTMTVALAIMGAADTLPSQEPFTLRAVAPGVYIAVAGPTTVTELQRGGH